MVQPKHCLTAKRRDSRVPTHTSPGSVGRPVTAPGPSGGSMPQDPEASGSFRPLPSLVWAGSALQNLFCLGDRTSQLAERASWPPGPGTTHNSPVEPNVFEHTRRNLHGPTRCCTQAQSGGRSKKKKKKIDLVASSLPWCFGPFPVSSASPRTPGLPRPWGPRDSGLWFGKLADEVFVCLLLREGRWEEEAQGKGVQSLALVV